MPSLKKDFINPVHVFIAIIIVAVIWLVPVMVQSKPSSEAENNARVENEFRFLVTVPIVGADPPDVCSDDCKEWYCEHKIPGGGCSEWTFHCAGCSGGGENQPPAISHVLNCSQPGSNGWCIGNLSLDLTASDPQASQLIISGDVNGTAFLCPAGNTTCSIPLPEGAGNTNYRVDAAATGLTASGTTTYLLDSSTPQLSGSVSGVVGVGGWYKSNVGLSVIASDQFSGIASTETTIDGGPWTVYAGPLSLSDGVHTVVMKTTDNAGHVTQTTQPFSIDTITPVLNIALSGTMGANNWYVSNVTVTPSANDTGSRLASLEATIDGGPWTVVNGPLLFTDGVHSYQIRATDNAGNITESGQTLNVDITTPSLNLTTTGTTGLNGWYRSTAQITALGTDATSGVAKIEVSTNGGAFLPYTAPVTVNDGQHSYQFKVTDNAGNVTQSTKTVKVDTVTPSLSLTLSGAKGQNDWYVSNTSVTPTATDSTSGIATLEVSQNGSAYVAYHSTSFSDGLHTYRFKATDNAGNVTETPVQNLKVDTIAPVIEMKDELKLGEYLYYDLEDPTVTGQENSGLFIYRAVIEDDSEKYKKIVWLDALAGDKAENSILWDGKFADGVQAGWGDYFVTLKISDAAGNERMQTAIVKVGLLSLLEEIPAFIPPASVSMLLPAQTTQTDSAAVTEFGGANSGTTGEATSETEAVGGENNEAKGDESVSIAAGGIAVFNSETEYVKSGFTQESQSTTIPITNPNLLWGAAATAVLGATLADWQRRREEEEARKRAEAAAHEEDGGGGGGGKKTPGQRAYEKMMQQKHIVGKSQAELNEKAARQRVLDEYRTGEKAYDIAQATAQQQARDEYHAGERGYAVQQAEKAEQQAGLSAYYEGRKAGEKEASTTSIVETNWLANVWNQYAPLTIQNTLKDGTSFIDKRIYQPYIQPNVNLKSVAATVLTVALGVTGAYWGNNVAHDPHVFDDAFKNTKSEWQRILEIHPPTAENMSDQYLFTNPFEAFSIGYDTTQALANSVAGYLDALWQANPLAQISSNALQYVGDQCPTGAGEAWARRCSAAFYFGASVVEHPADTIVGVVTSLVAEPVAGYVKLASFIFEYNNPYQLIKDISQNGLGEMIQERLAIFSDPSVQAFGILALFTLATIAGLGIPALILGGAMVLGQTATLLTQIDTALQAALTRAEAMNVVVDPKVRRQLATTIVLLGLVTYGGARGLQEFNAFQDSLPPSAQTVFSDLSYLKQARVFETARRLGPSLEVLEFYLTESARPGSPMAELSIVDGLRLSELKVTSSTSLIEYIYDARAGQYRDISTGRFVSPRDLPWPDNNGFAQSQTNTTLVEGTLIDRYGELTGRFAGAPGTSISARGMALGSEDMPYTVLRVIKPITVPGGPAAAVPEFGATGGGMQYFFKGSIQWWIENGYLEVVP